MRVFVLGQQGMLGHVVARYLAQLGCQVVTSPLRYAAQARDPLIETVRDSGCTWIVNAIGRIKQKSDNPAELFLANSLFPLHLSLRLRPDQRLVHASTDCVSRAGKGITRSKARGMPRIFTASPKSSVRQWPGRDGVS